MLAVHWSVLSLAIAAALALPGGQAPTTGRAHRPTYAKQEHRIAMRDGIKLHTAVYSPTTCAAGGYPIMLNRTPYGVESDGADQAVETLGPSSLFGREGFIFVYQDVRGRHLSEGVWEEVRPYVPPPERAPHEVNEATDAWDTIDWLVRRLSCTNGRVGMWGISYPGFYVSSAMVEAHPALRAVSPQGPVTDYYLNDDSYHNGAFLLAHNFGFYVNFPPRGAAPRRRDDRPDFDFGTDDGYDFHLRLGSLADATRKYGLTNNPYWMMNLEHTTYDAFWKARSLWRHFTNVAPAVLTVGGWYDAENLWGALRTYRAVREQSPSTTNHLVMGPWTHGDWASGDGRRVGALDFGEATARHYRERIEFPFFMRHLKDRGDAPLPAASIFETGNDRWRTFDAWPPAGLAARTFHLGPNGGLTVNVPAVAGATSYESDPARPVPLVGEPARGMPRSYMAADQRFAAARDDVLVYTTAPLEADMTTLGPVEVDLHVSTSGTDSDFVVKLIDVHPEVATARSERRPKPTSGYQQLIRGEPFRGKFRAGFETPVAFVPGQPSRIAFTLGEVAHTFKRGHRVMVQVQSSWFPLIDRNPQTFTHIPEARPEQFVKATQHVYHGGSRASSITLRVR